MEGTILILGCGVMQIPALRLARGLGWKVAAVDGNPEAPGRIYCDEFLQVDLKDTEGIIAAAKMLGGGKGPQGVFTAGTDFSLAAAMAAEALGLPGHSVEAARRATDKVLMRRAFREARVPSPQFGEITDEKGLDRLLAQVPGPWIVKPVDSMGARGVMRVEEAEKLGYAVETAKSYSRSGRALLETYMEGPEFSLDALVEDKRLIRCGLADRIIAYPPHFIEIGHTIPSSADAQTAEALWEVFEDGIHALGLTRGAAKGDVILTPKGPMIGEIAARLSGGYMSGWTWPAASGVEPTLGGLRLAMGLSAGDMTSRRHLVCAERALVGIDGTVRKLEGREEAMARSGVQEVFLRYRPGESIVFPRNNVEKAANVIAVGSNAQEAESRAMSALQALRLVLDPSDQTTGVYLESFDDFPPDAFDVHGFFDNLWKAHPPHPSRGCIQVIPKVSIPRGLPLSRDSAGRTMRDVLVLLNDERRLRLQPMETQEMTWQAKSDFWKALVRGGAAGLRWYLDTARL